MKDKAKIDARRLIREPKESRVKLHAPGSATARPFADSVVNL